MPLLEIADLEVRYGQILGTNGLSFAVEAGETIALVGANGAGKSSCLKAILGMVDYPRGEILWRGKSIHGLKPFEVMRLGIGYSPEGRRVFPALTVHENLRVGAYTRSPAEFGERIEKIYGYFPELKQRLSQAAGSLSGGEQQMLAIGRALMSLPKLFLLDEPSLGLAPIIVERIGMILLEVQAQENISVILAEQNANWALTIASRAVILELGKDVAHGSAEELRKTPRIRDAYLGAA
jgi:branched-chain amino acid transport system ATP-binding protein